ncbi:14653_t:CDS:1 [Funneliformis geosporum]|uniref:14653_t:CDS:1 n=1 Tax=Funneliformis geosporum TaxID=1117311 RepID=A0A9W4WK09_9GLOM|nr:14653_t:CDS:1 [Funneliformis geosporum]
MNKLITTTTLIINKNIDENNTKMNKKPDISDSSLNNNLIDVKLPLPPTLTKCDIKNAIKSNINKGRAKTFPNAFIAYRMALTKEYHNNNITLPRMGLLSKIAKKAWEKESQDIKDIYNKLAEDAKSLYKQKNFEIVFDKRMEMTLDDQQSERTDMESNSVNTDYFLVENTTITQHTTDNFHPIQDFTSDIHSSHYNNFNYPPVNSPNISEVPYEMNSTFNDREEYICILEQTICYLLHSN